MREAASFIASQSSAEVGLVHVVLQFVERTLRAWRNRRTIASLNELDDHLLADLGVSRDDVRKALDLPFSHDPGRDLQHAALCNRARGWNI